MRVSDVKAEAEAEAEAIMEAETTDGEDGEVWDGDAAKDEAETQYQNTLQR